MKKMLQKKLNKKGFTLAELLVVVGIIAVLVAIAIPMFSAANNKAYEGVAEANARSAYGEWAIAYIADGTAPNVNDTITYTTGGKSTVCKVTAVSTANNAFSLTITATVQGGDAAGYGPFEFSSVSAKS